MYNSHADTVQHVKQMKLHALPVFSAMWMNEPDRYGLVYLFCKMGNENFVRKLNIVVIDIIYKRVQIIWLRILPYGQLFNLLHVTITKVANHT